MRSAFWCPAFSISWHASSVDRSRSMNAPSDWTAATLILRNSNRSLMLTISNFDRTYRVITILVDKLFPFPRRGQLQGGLIIRQESYVCNWQACSSLAFQEKKMRTSKSISLIAVLLALPAVAFAADKPAKRQKGSAAVSDVCTPIGKTADGKLIYSLDCESIPSVNAPSAPPAAQIEDRTERSGLFGFSLDRGRGEDEPRRPAVPPSPN